MANRPDANSPSWVCSSRYGERPHRCREAEDDVRGPQCTLAEMLSEHVLPDAGVRAGDGRSGVEARWGKADQEGGQSSEDQQAADECTDGVSHHTGGDSPPDSLARRVSSDPRRPEQSGAENGEQGRKESDVNDENDGDADREARTDTTIEPEGRQQEAEQGADDGQRREGDRFPHPQTSRRGWRHRSTSLPKDSPGIGTAGRGRNPFQPPARAQSREVAAVRRSRHRRESTLR